MARIPKARSATMARTSYVKEQRIGIVKRLILTQSVTSLTSLKAFNANRDLCTSMLRGVCETKLLSDIIIEKKDNDCFAWAIRKDGFTVKSLRLPWNNLCTSIRSLRRQFKLASTKGLSASTALADDGLNNLAINASKEVIVVPTYSFAQSYTILVILYAEKPPSTFNVTFFRLAPLGLN